MFLNSDQWDGYQPARDRVYSVIKGGAGVWGPVPMPANTQVTPAEAKTLVQWVLSQK